MRTVLIPVDLADAAENVLEYAAEFCLDTCVERVILLKCHYVSVYQQLLPSPDFVQLSSDDIDDEREQLKIKLAAAGHKLQKKCSHGIEIETALSDKPLLRAIHDQIATNQPNLVMVGSDKTSYESNNRSGEQIVAIAKTSTVPVLIIPSNVKYKKIAHALVPCDFGAVSRLSALNGFNSRQKWIYPELLVLNTDAKQNHLSGSEKLATGLADMLEGYDYKVYNTDDKDAVQGILAFARKHDVQLIIALPGKYSFFYNLTHKSITNALATNALRPVLIL